MVRAVALACVVLLCAGTGPAQERSFAVILKGTYTTASELFPAPDAADPVVRASSLALDGIPGGGLEVRYLLSDLNLAIGVSVEYLAGTTPRRIDGLPADVTADDGFRAVPVELTGYFTLPFSGRSFAVHMGGGGGVYFGRRILRIGGAEAAPVEESPGFGIHVGAGVSWRPAAWTAIFADLKFRDLQFETVSAFRDATVTVDGRIINLPREPFPARVSTTGMVIEVGVAFPL